MHILKTITAISLLCLPLPLLAAEDVSRLQVQAEASIDTTPDKAMITASLWETTPTFTADNASSSAQSNALKQARERLEARTSKLLQALEQAGVAHNNIHAGSLVVQPESLPNSEEARETSQQTRIRIERPLNVTLDDLSQVATIIDALIAVGVNRFDGISYDVADRSSIENEALVAAIERARHKARLMAETLGVKLGTVVDVQETRTPVFRPLMMAVSETARAKSADYNPGDMRVDAGVMVTWQISPQ
ncbi:SIMPL domain-containing protein [Phytohalomonas tamaricis]|uniref:SIMPL domain-containing protein n=1 Tax=Phytohalomonas tamaricis TaxID=2081032 RepID=UPI000D0AC25C|nr:SIMPL domain-containing protein [Phytohalomonas tamaricis]